MDWDGVGTFALFLATGAVGISVVMLKAYGLKLRAKLEREQLRQHGAADSQELLEKVESLQTEVGRLTERLDFTEKLLNSGEKQANTPS